MDEKYQVDWENSRMNKHPPTNPISVASPRGIMNPLPAMMIAAIMPPRANGSRQNSTGIRTPPQDLCCEDGQYENHRLENQIWDERHHYQL
jgi:hypothetical protein